MSTSENPPVQAEPQAARRFFSRTVRWPRFELFREVETRMAERLPLVRIEPARVLDAGAGRGEGLRLLAGRYPQAACIGLDWSRETLSAARRTQGLHEFARNLLGASRLHWACADLGALPVASASCDLVWSNLALSWADPPGVLGEFRRVLKAGGLLMFSTYGPDTLKELRACFAREDDYQHVLDFPDMHDLGDMLGVAGLSQPVMDMELITLTYSGFDHLVRDLRQSGQSNSAERRRRGLTGRQRWQRVGKTYDGLRRDGRLPATFEIIYGHAWAQGEPRRRDGRSVINTDFSRAKRFG